MKQNEKEKKEKAETENKRQKIKKLFAMKKLFFLIKKFICEKLYEKDFINSFSIDYVDLKVKIIKKSIHLPFQSSSVKNLKTLTSK